MTADVSKAGVQPFGALDAQECDNHWNYEQRVNECRCSHEYASGKQQEQYYGADALRLALYVYQFSYYRVANENSFFGERQVSVFFL